MRQTNRNTDMRAKFALAAALITMGVTGTGCSSGNERGIVRYEVIPRGAYAIVAEVQAKPGRADELRAATLPLVNDVRDEPNNLLYFLQEDRETPGRFVFYEIFETKEDFDSHNATEHVQAWFAKIPDLTDGSVRVTRLRILGN